MAVSLLALQWTGVAVAILVVALLLGFWLVPYLVKEIGEGKKEFGPLRRMWPGGRRAASGPSTPSGASDVRPGTFRDPAPGQPDAQADPYGPAAQRRGPAVHS
jgi:hypothetical protein